jgi:hypothetical protein
MDIVEEMRGFEIDHEPDGWPAVRMRQVSALCDEIERLRGYVAHLAAPVGWKLVPLRPTPEIEDKADVVSKALRKAWQLGQTYWQQADSEYTSQHRKADETQAKFQTLVDETRAAILADVTPNALAQADAACGVSHGAPGSAAV